jgi:hypothetical protein
MSFLILFTVLALTTAEAGERTGVLNGWDYYTVREDESES